MNRPKFGNLGFILLFCDTTRSSPLYSRTTDETADLRLAELPVQAQDHAAREVPGRDGAGGAVVRVGGGCGAALPDLRSTRTPADAAGEHAEHPLHAASGTR